MSVSWLMQALIENTVSMVIARSVVNTQT